MASSADARFWSKIRIGPNPHPERVKGDCWVWAKAFRDEDGYGLFVMSEGRTVRAHRWSYCRAKNIVFDSFAGEVLDHLCRNRSCVRPDHLEHVTAKVNAERSAAGEKTHCHRGHEFTPENTRIKKNGTRACKKCHVDDERERKRRVREKRAWKRTLAPGSETGSTTVSNTP